MSRCGREPRLDIITAAAAAAAAHKQMAVRVLYPCLDVGVELVSEKKKAKMSWL